MKNTWQWTLGTGLVVILMSLMGMQTPAEGQNGLFSYAAKFVCGTRNVDGLQVVRGVYGSTVNIHNPHVEPPVRFLKKAVVARPQRTSRGRISRCKEEQLDPDQALGVDCRDISNLLGVTGFVEGFLVIYTQEELDVVEVLTARQRNGDVETIHAREVTPKRVIAPACPQQ